MVMLGAFSLQHTLHRKMGHLPWRRAGSKMEAGRSLARLGKTRVAVLYRRGSPDAVSDFFYYEGFCHKHFWAHVSETLRGN